MPIDLTQQVLRSIERRQMMRGGDRVGVGVSGGADSVALLRLLAELRAKLGIALAVLHFNHQLRGAESDADERFVAELARAHGLELLAGSEDVAGAARTRGWNLEDAARRLRYAFFATTVKAGRIARVAVAHTADDQAETVLARLVRGTGPAGLAAIYPVKGHVVRPLLETRRDALRAYLERLRQPWREDASNLDTTRLRAKLRHNVLPALEKTLQPALVAHLCRLAEMARQDEAFWTTLVAERMAALTRREERRIGIRCADILCPMRELAARGAGGEALGERGRDAQGALAGRLVRAIAEELRGDGGQIRGQLTAQHVQQALQLAAGASGRRAELPGMIAERSFEWIWFEAAAAGQGDAKTATSAGQTKRRAAARKAKAAAFSHAVRLGGAGESTVIAVPEIGRRFRLKVIDWPAAGVDTRGEGAIDRDLLHSPLELRNWRPGDAFRPRGRRYAHKMKRFLGENRIAARDRAGWPVLTSQDALVWARGLPVAAKFAAGKAARAAVTIAEEEL